MYVLVNLIYTDEINCTVTRLELIQLIINNVGDCQLFKLQIMSILHVPKSYKINVGHKKKICFLLFLG